MKALNHGADVDAIGVLGTPLMIFASMNNVDALDVLLEAGVSANAAQDTTGKWSLHFAICEINGIICCDAVRALLRK